MCVAVLPSEKVRNLQEKRSISLAVARMFAMLPGKIAARLLLGTRLQTQAHRFNHLATSIHRETGLATHAYKSAAGHSTGNLGFEVSLLMAETYAKHAARPLANKSFDRALFEQAVRSTLTEVSNGRAPANDFGWSLSEFVMQQQKRAGQVVRPAAIEAANMLLTDDGSKRLFGAFNQFTKTTLSPKMLKVTAPIDEKAAVSAVEAFEARLLSKSSSSMVVEPFTARDKQALVDFALARRPIALLRDTTSWFSVEKVAQGQRDWRLVHLRNDMQSVGEALLAFTQTIEPGVSRYVSRAVGQANLSSAPTPFWHTDSPNRPLPDMPAMQGFLARAVVSPNALGPLVMMNGTVIAAQPGQLMLMWGEPMRLFGFANREPGLHTSPFMKDFRGRLLGLGAVLSKPMNSNDMVPRAEWGVLKPSKS